MTREDIWEKITLDEIESIVSLSGISKKDVERILKGTELENYKIVIRMGEDFVTARTGAVNEAHQQVYNDWMKWLTRILS